MCKHAGAFCSPVQEEEHDANLGVVCVLEDCEVHTTHEPVEACGEAAPDGAELLKHHGHLVIYRQADYAYCHSPMCAHLGHNLGATRKMQEAPAAMYCYYSGMPECSSDQRLTPGEGSVILGA